MDKHKALIPVGSAYAHFVMTTDMAAMLNESFGGNRPPAKMSVRFGPSKRIYPLEDGATLLSAPTGSFEPPLHDEPQFAFGIAFGDGQIIDGEALIPALTQICEFVEGVVGIVERRLF